MSRRDPGDRIRHMLDHAREAVSLVSGKERRDLEKDRVLELALLRLLEVVGEAANRVPGDVRITYPGIPWGQVIGMRNRLIHAYDTVDMDIMWQVLTVDLPALVFELEGGPAQ